jgi:hypothetical protein
VNTESVNTFDPCRSELAREEARPGNKEFEAT